jgi:cell division protein ZipA
MQTNWSLILNVVLLTGVVVAIVRILKAKRVSTIGGVRGEPKLAPSVSAQTDKMDEVIAVRKVNREVAPAVQVAPPALKPYQPVIEPRRVQPVTAAVVSAPKVEKISASKTNAAPLNASKHQPTSLVIFLLAKANRQLAGYELLQTILSAGLRFGEGHLFHRHQHPNGQGPVLCSLATATASGVFDLQNIGAFSVHGLCLFMETSGNTTIDSERLSIMVDTAKLLSEGLDTLVLDDERKPWSTASEQRYAALLDASDVHVNEALPA